MLEAILDYLHNWFPVKGAAKSGTFEIASGVLAFDGLLQGQYYRVQGSVFNDGLHKAGERLTDEVFSGTVTPLAVPPLTKPAKAPSLTAILLAAPPS